MKTPALVDENRTAGEAGWHLSRYNLMTVIPGEEKAVVANLFRAVCAVYSPEELYLLSEAENLPEDHPILDLFRKRGLIVDFDEREALADMGRKLRNASDQVTLTVPIVLKTTAGATCREKPRTMLRRWRIGCCASLVRRNCISSGSAESR